MANTSRKGFWPHRHIGGTPWNGAVNKYVILSGQDTAIGIGDLVKLGTTGGVTNPAYHSVLHFGAATSDVVLGVVVGFGPDSSQSRFIPSSNRWTDQAAERLVYVMDDANVLLVGESTTAIAAASLGLDAPVAAAVPSTATGYSNQVIGTPAALATSPLKIIGYLDSPDNELNSANNKLVVKMNSHAYSFGQLGV